MRAHTWFRRREAAKKSPGAGNPPPIPVPDQGDKPLFVDFYSEIGNWAAGQPSGNKKTRALWAAGQPMGRWVGKWDEQSVGLKQYIDAAAAVNKYALALSYYMPGLDLGGYSSGGAAPSQAAYEAYIDNMRLAIGTRKVVLVYEPDSLTQADSMSSDARPGRIALMKASIAELKGACPNLWLYVDGGHSAWHPAQHVSDLLHEVDAQVANGVALNVSNIRPDAELVPYGQQVCQIFNSPNFNFIYDTGRNGNPVATEPWQWANPPQRQFGKLPQFGNTGISRCDGWMWWKRQGESDGPEYSTWAPNGAPAAGVFWPAYMWNDSVGDNVSSSTIENSSGMLQRPPVPGVAGSPAPPVARPTGQTTGNWNKIFEDEFTGTSLNTAKWKSGYYWDADGGTNDGNNEEQWFKPEQLNFNNSILTLTAQPENSSHGGRNYTYKSGAIITGPTFGGASKFDFTYGYMEARIKVPKGQGWWPAFWTLPTSTAWPPEIDVMEFLGPMPGTIHQHFHYLNSSGVHTDSGGSYQPAGVDFSLDYHVYGVDWTNTAIRWYVDGVETRTAFSDAARIPNIPLYLIVNLSVGGNWLDDVAGGGPNSGNPVSGTSAQMLVDWVRVWQRA
jgi:beta-glucanase (GH16 family)